MMNKYHTLVYNRIKETILEWSKCEYVLESDLYRFMHSIIGTAGTVGLPDISSLLSDKLQDLDETGARQWSKTEWQAYLHPLQEIVKTVDPASDEDHAAVPVDMPPKEPEAGFVLFIDDDLDFVVRLKEYLEHEGYAVSIALTAQKGLELYYQLKPDSIAINMHLPDDSGFELLKQIVNKARKENTPIAIMGSDDSKENRLLTYTIGALDFIPKPIDPEVLSAYLHNRISHKKEMDRAIINDELTGAFNRKHFNTMLRMFLTAINQKQQPFCLVLMDLDHFKQVNDTYGHLKGDEVLQAFVRIARQIKRENDFLFRYGGEEFAFLLPDTSGETAKKLMQRLRDALAEHRFESAQGSFQVTFSSGVMQASSESLQPGEMIGKADQALYHAKQNGRNRTIVYQEHLLVDKQPSRLHIIIIDDVFIVREVLSRQFMDWVPASQAAVTVSAYEDGVSFLRSNWYKREDQYVILLDGMLPALDGIEVLKEIRRTYSSDNVIVTMLTARGKEFDVVNAIQHGADDYIVKPFQAESVPARIQRLVSRRFG